VSAPVELEVAGLCLIVPLPAEAQPVGSDLLGRDPLAGVEPGEELLLDVVLVPLQHLVPGRLHRIDALVDVEHELARRLVGDEAALRRVIRRAQVPVDGPRHPHVAVEDGDADASRNPQALVTVERRVVPFPAVAAIDDPACVEVIHHVVLRSGRRAAAAEHARRDDGRQQRYACPWGHAPTLGQAAGHREKVSHPTRASR